MHKNQIHKPPSSTRGLQNGMWCLKGKAAVLQAVRLPGGLHRSRRHGMTPSVQKLGQFTWNLWMPSFIFPDRCMQNCEQFHANFLTSPGAFMVEEDAVHSKEIVGLSEVHHNPVGIQLCCPYKHNLKTSQLPALLVHSSDRHTYTSHTQGEVHKSAVKCVRIWFILYTCHILYGKNIQPIKQQLNRKMPLFCAASELARKHLGTFSLVFLCTLKCSTFSFTI